MLDTPFSFRGRTGRLGYFKGCVALTLACVIPVVLALMFLGPIREGSTAGLVMLLALLVVFAIVIFWLSLALQVRRCRDIGWNPLFVIPAWMLIQAADPLFAHLVPSLAVGKEHEQTLVGGLINLGLFLAFLFWPSSGDSGSPAAPARRDPDPLRRAPRPAVPTTASAATLPAAARTPTLPAKPVFGRR